MKIQVFKSTKNKQWYFRFVAKNQKTVAQSEGYKRRGSARKGLDSILKSVTFDDLEVEYL